MNRHSLSSVIQTGKRVEILDRDYGIRLESTSNGLSKNPFSASLGSETNRTGNPTPGAIPQGRGPRKSSEFGRGYALGPWGPQQTGRRHTAKATNVCHPLPAKRSRIGCRQVNSRCRLQAMALRGLWRRLTGNGSIDRYANSEK